MLPGRSMTISLVIVLCESLLCPELWNCSRLFKNVFTPHTLKSHLYIYIYEGWRSFSNHTIIFNWIKCYRHTNIKHHTAPHNFQEDTNDVLPSPTTDLESDVLLYLGDDCPIRHRKCPDDFEVVEQTSSGDRRDAYG